MNLNHLKKFAQGARRKLMAEVAARLDYLLGHDDAYIRANEAHVREIRRRLAEKGREQLVEEVAYTWFNRIVALRFMDLRGYTKVRIVSPQTGQVQPELLYQIKQGRTPKALQSLQETFDAYLTGRIRTDQPDREIYTAALLGMCNDYTGALPFLFRRVDEYMAVLLPTDLLSENSILADVQNAIAEEEVKDVEVIGWLYQFYISEKKDQVFARPKGEKIKKEDIPAATQLFTPHWIVRYMVENSLGRLWRNNFPDTRVSEQMDYYIEGDPEPDYLKISGPEEITLLDPACGSGHILTYAFDLLYAMYEEAGYTPSEIPSLILQNNLYGIDIDTRAAELAAFALTMKAREKDRFFFQREVEPNVIAMEDVDLAARGAGVSSSSELNAVFELLKQSSNFGALIPLPRKLKDELTRLRTAMVNNSGASDLFRDAHQDAVIAALDQLFYLSRRCHCVVTNPPYMSVTNANHSLQKLVKRQYGIAASDLYAVFIIRGLELVATGGYLGIVTQHSWMFLQSFEALRTHVIENCGIESLVHLGPHAFEAIGGEVVQVAAVVLSSRAPSLRSRGVFVRLVDSDSKERTFLEPNSRISCEQRRFRLLPGKPIAYWVAQPVFDAYSNCDMLQKTAFVGMGMRTGDNARFVRNWQEVSIDTVGDLATSDEQATGDIAYWVPYQSGGRRRKWYGNAEKLVYWKENGKAIKEATIENYPSLSWDSLSWKITNEDRYFQRGITWSAVSTETAFRYYEAGQIFSNAGQSVIPSQSSQFGTVLGYLNSRVVEYLRPMLSPKVGLEAGYVGKLPYCEQYSDMSGPFACVSISLADWDSHEYSRRFQRLPLITDYTVESHKRPIDKYLAQISWPSAVGEVHSIAEAYASYSSHWSAQFKELHRLEEENNRIFIDLYGLQDELSPEVPYSEVTILQDELDKDARERGEIVFNKKEVLRQFVSYGVGCIFGRYSLDEDGLILANAGDTIDTYLERIPDPRLRPDESGILPITEDDDFPDDLPSQFRAFLRAAFGTEQYDENLQFLEEGLGRDLRSYFLKEFYKDHLKRYKKRPIYWLITSPKGSLRALIYLHRYNKDTVNRFLNDYLRPYQRKLEARRRTAEQSLNTGGLSGPERTKARKDIDRISAALDELSLWERQVVRPLAEQRVELDLDDGVKVNYGKLGAILETVKGLNA